MHAVVRSVDDVHLKRRGGAARRQCKFDARPLSGACEEAREVIPVECNQPIVAVVADEDGRTVGPRVGIREALRVAKELLADAACA